MFSIFQFFQIYTTLATDYSSTVQSKKKTSKNMSSKTVDIPATTSYIVVMTGSAGSVYQPLNQQQLISPLFPNFASQTAVKQQHQHQLTIPGTSVPLPLQPLVNFSPNHISGMSDVLTSSHQVALITKVQTSLLFV